MKRLLAIALIVSAVAVPLTTQAAKAAKETKFKLLGTDASNDAPPAADLTSLMVGKSGLNLSVRIGVANLLPVQGSYPGAGIEWTFDVGSRTFVAEAHPADGGDFEYTLFEVRNGSFSTVSQLKGAVVADESYILMSVPLQTIGAKRGTVISGVGAPGTPDVDIHQHAQVTSQLLDEFATAKDYIIP